MITLHLLGGAWLEGEGGRLTGEPVQRHRLALLALLALARDHRAPREGLLALLWPEHGPREARQLLNVSVYVLRRTLGKDTIRSEGDDLRLDLDGVRCDVVELRAALERGDASAAAELYAGPFMDGFVFDASHEFDAWLEARRAELEVGWLGALSILAERAEADGDLAAACRHVRHILRRRPTEERATLELMRLLELSGDRAGALEVAAEHGRTLGEAFGAAPSASVEALADRMREQPLAPVATVGAAGASLPAPLPGPPVRTDVSGSAESGVRDVETVPDTDRRGAPPARRPARLPLLFATAAALVAALSFVGRGGDGGDGTRVDLASVAVLPFRDVSPEGDHRYFGNGLAEQLRTSLAQTPGLRVAAGSSSMRFDTVSDLRSAGRELGVAAIVEGSVLIAGDRLRVTTRLVDTETGHHLWSERYDRSLSDVFAVQEELARAVATELSAELARQLPDTVVATTTADAAAYTLYLRGRHEWRKRTEEGMWAALDAFQRAVELDPGYAAAYAGLSDTWQLLPDYGDVHAAEGLARAKTAALRAVALDSTLAEAHVSLAAVLDDYDHDRRGAEAAYRRAVALNPGYVTARHWLAIHLADDGRFDEALEQIEIARRLDPLSDIVNTAAGAVRYFARDYEGAKAEYRSVLDLRPDFALAWALLGRAELVDGRVDRAVASLERSVELSGGDPSYRAVYAAALATAGRSDEARTVADDLYAAGSDSYVPYCELASAYVALGDEGRALELFTRGLEDRDPALKHLAVEPLYDAIRAHPEFEALLSRAGLTEE